jgi:hypothetical protein
VVSDEEEVGESPDEAEATPTPTKTANEGGGWWSFLFWCCGSIFIIAALLTWVFWSKIRAKLHEWGTWPYSEDEISEIEEARNAADADGLAALARDEDEDSQKSSNWLSLEDE